MRDIRSHSTNSRRPPFTSSSSSADGLPPVPKNSSDKKKPLERRRFTGSRVPVTNIHLEESSQKSIKPTAPKEATPEPQTSEIDTGPARPLFAKANPKAKKQQMRLGNRERLVAGVFGLLLLIALLIAGFIFLPKATITLALQTAPLLVDERLTLKAIPTDTPAPLESGVVPATSFFRALQVKGSSPVESTEIIGTKTTGTVDIVNRTTEEQKIKEQSRLLSSDGQLFYMQGHAIIPPANGGSLARVSVPVIADVAGAQANSVSGRLNFAGLDESSQSLVYAEVTTPLSGGSGEAVKVVKEADIARARENAIIEARKQAEEEIRAELPNGWVALEESWQGEVNDFTTTATVDERLEEIPYTAQITVHVMGYEETALQKELQRALTAKLDQDYMLFPGPISFTKSLEAVNWETNTAEIAVRVTHTTVPMLSVDTLQDKLAGRDKDAALLYLRGLKGVKTANIELWPFWVRSVPTIMARVKVDIQQGK